MKPILIDDFANFKFVSNPTFSPNGKALCFNVAEADMENNKYKSSIYMKKGTRITRLTSGNKERGFQFLDDNTILFQSNREEGEKAQMGSHFYTISLNGGEAELALSLPLQVSKITPLKNGDFLVLGMTMPGFEDLYLADPEYLAKYQAYVKENEDYEEISQVPFWWNGATFTKGAYTSLFYYMKKKNKLIRLSAINENIQEMELSRDEKYVYYAKSEVKPMLDLGESMTLCRMKLLDHSVKELAASSKEFMVHAFVLADSFILLAASDGKYGLNTDVDFYRMDYETGEITLLSLYGEAIGSSVGCDIRYGGGRAVKMMGDTLYFVSTRFDSSYLYKLEDGVISQVIDREGSLDSFDIYEDNMVLSAFYDMKGQELYDEKGKQITKFNDKLLKNKYVAKPDIFNISRGEYDIHGFVLHPMNEEEGRKYPVIIDIHGGPKTVYGPVFYHEMQYWAGKGYYVIFCNPTGSDGRNAFMDIRGIYGTVDFDDIMAFCDAALEAYPAMDKDNFFETGGSYGGFMTNWIIGHTDRFRACASQRSISNWSSFYGVSDIGVGFTKDQQQSTPWDNPELLWERSPLKYADKVKTPTLFIHAFEDYRCPIDQGYQMFTALISHGIEAKMVCFRGENHDLSRSGKPKHRVKRLKEITDWFDTHQSK